MLENSLGDNSDLGCQRHSKFTELFLGRFVLSGSVTRFLVQFVNLSLDALGLFAVLPDFVPVRSLSGRSSVNDLEHEFCRVLFIVTVSSTVVLEVIKQSSGVLADVAKVHSLTTLGQEQETVKFLEQNSTGLMNSTKDGLTSVGELTKESTDGPSALGIQTTSTTLVRN